MKDDAAVYPIVRAQPGGKFVDDRRPFPPCRECASPDLLVCQAAQDFKGLLFIGKARQFLWAEHPNPLQRHSDDGAALL
jgi:hypothetical protein